MRKSIKISLTKKQKKILIGLLLGDGSLEFNGYKGTRLQLKQSKEKKAYIFWLYKEFRNLCSSPPRQRKDNQEWYFATRYLINLTYYYQMFYQRKKKVVPKEIDKLLVSPLSLAVWFMDDGSLDFRPRSHYAFLLHTEGFKKKEVSLLVATIRKNFGIKARIHKSSYRGQRKYKIYIGKEARGKFYSLVESHILETFRYKLPPILPNPSETSRY